MSGQYDCRDVPEGLFLGKEFLAFLADFALDLEFDLAKLRKYKY